MPRYRRRPTEHEVFQFNRQQREDWPEWMKGPEVRIGAFFIPGEEAKGPGHIRIHTREGDMVALPGWWVVQGTKGELYAVAPDIFPEIYEALP